MNNLLYFEDVLCELRDQLRYSQLTGNWELLLQEGGEEEVETAPYLWNVFSTEELDSFDYFDFLWFAYSMKSSTQGKVASWIKHKNGALESSNLMSPRGKFFKQPSNYVASRFSSQCISNKAF
ncbi:hypothetical protein Taro_046754, partial [Colocasia esculenta]|nr:hypothetical protein [Colocasia esculenta]